MYYITKPFYVIKAFYATKDYFIKNKLAEEILNNGILNKDLTNIAMEYVRPKYKSLQTDICLSDTIKFNLYGKNSSNITVTKNCDLKKSMTGLKESTRKKCIVM